MIIWPSPPNWTCIHLYKTGFKAWISSNLHSPPGWMEKNFQDAWRSFWMDGNAVWPLQRSEHFYACYKSSIASLYRQICGGIFWWHPYFQLWFAKPSRAFGSSSHGLTVLWRDQLVVARKKYFFCVTHVLFLGYIIFDKGLQVDPSKVDAIRTWPTPKTISEVSCFHGLASFYRCFIHHFINITAPLTDCMKGSSFVWTPATNTTFELSRRSLLPLRF